MVRFFQPSRLLAVWLANSVTELTRHRKKKNSILLQPPHEILEQPPLPSHHDPGAHLPRNDHG